MPKDMRRNSVRDRFWSIAFPAIVFLGIARLPGEPLPLQNDVFWKDLSGNPIYSQGGGVLKVGDTWYWYGAKYTGAVTYCNNPTKKNSDITFSAVTCYSSTDLVRWKFEGNVLTGQNGWFGRLGVAYNRNTNKYVLVAQGGGGILFAVSATPNGTYTLKAWVQSSGGQGTCRVFTGDFGGTEVSYAINKAMGSWTQITLSGITITNGACRVGIESAANAGNWCKVDDLSLVNSYPDRAIVPLAANALQLQPIRRALVSIDRDGTDLLGSSPQATIVSLLGKRMSRLLPGGIRGRGFASGVYLLNFNDRKPKTSEPGYTPQ